MEVRVRADLKPLQKQARLTQKQTRFATVNTLTKVAGRVETFERIKVKQDLDRPTRFTVNAFAKFRARFNRLTAGVFIKDAQFNYLRWQIYGGVQRFKNRRPVPIAIKTNQFGNIPRKRLTAVRAKPNVFSVGADKELTLERLGRRRGIRALVLWIRKAVYARRFKFFQHGHTIVNRWLVKDWNSAVNKELRRIERK